jgi:hypothetical protein
MSPLQLLSPLCICSQVWELVPAALQKSLQELVGEKGEGAVEEAEVSRAVHLYRKCGSTATAVLPPQYCCHCPPACSIDLLSCKAKMRISEADSV